MFVKKPFALLTLFTILLFTSNCGGDSEEDYVINPEFTKHVSAFTSGVISSQSAIEIELTKPYEGKFVPNEAIKEELFEISPAISGKTVWLDSRTIQFIPDDKFESGETYWVEFDLAKVASVPKDLSIFKFPISIIEQAITFEVDGLRAYDSETIKLQQFLGNVIAADAIDKETLKKCIDVQVNGTKKEIKWEQQADPKMYKLIVENVERTEKAGEIVVSWTGSSADIKGEGKVTHEIPALGDFKVTSVNVIQHPEQHILIRFSDPLLSGQNLNGLVEIRNHNNVRTAIATNELRIYPTNRLIGEKTVILNSAIKNCLSYKIGKDQQFTVQFEELKPAVRLVGKGTILPSSNGMVVPFEAVNLKAVDVRIIKIYENNIAQFFQTNNYDGSREVKRVGRVVRKKTIYLGKGKAIDFGRWNRFNLDLSEYIKVDQGAIYRVEIGFRKHHSTYTCETSEDIEMDESDWDEYDNTENEKWDYVSDYNHGYYYSDYFSGYNYNKKDDPCSYSYYRNKSVTKNIFASDIGIVAKSGTNGELFVVVTDLVSAQPISGASVLND